MKKIFLRLLIVVLIVGAYIYVNKLHYPALPIDSVSKKEVIQKLHNSDEKLILLKKENDRVWYIVDEKNQAIVDEVIKQFVSDKGWVFTEKMGAGLFFEKAGERLIITTQKWTKNYSITAIPANIED